MHRCIGPCARTRQCNNRFSTVRAITATDAGPVVARPLPSGLYSRRDCAESDYFLFNQVPSHSAQNFKHDLYLNSCLNIAEVEVKDARCTTLISSLTLSDVVPAYRSQSIPLEPPQEPALDELKEEVIPALNNLSQTLDASISTSTAADDQRIPHDKSAGTADEVQAQEEQPVDNTIPADALQHAPGDTIRLDLATLHKLRSSLETRPKLVVSTRYNQPTSGVAPSSPDGLKPTANVHPPSDSEDSPTDITEQAISPPADGVVSSESSDEKQEVNDDVAAYAEHQNDAPETHANNFHDADERNVPRDVPWPEDSPVQVESWRNGMHAGFFQFYLKCIVIKLFLDTLEFNMKLSHFPMSACGIRVVLVSSGDSPPPFQWTTRDVASMNLGTDS
jgi:hypothetical protein